MTVLLSGMVVALALADAPGLAALVCVVAIWWAAKDLRRQGRA